MREYQADIWTVNADAICVTTNGIVKANGRAVMGKGIALEAAQRFPGIDRTLGALIKAGGNKVHLLYERLASKDCPSFYVVSFPTKKHWRDKSIIDLIQTSCLQLINLTDDKKWNKVLLPRVGCGNGGLDWEREVKPIVEQLLDDRFMVCYK